MISSTQPYVIPPGVIPKSSYAEVAAFFSDRIPVVADSEVEGVQLSGESGAASELLNWAVNAGPDLFWKMSRSALAAYAGKKFLDGFATQAGKDFWEGVKKLCKFIGEKATKKVEDHRKVVLTAGGEVGESGTYFDVTVEIMVPQNMLELPPVLEQVEKVILPLCGCMSVEHKSLYLVVYQNRDCRTWNFRFLKLGPSYSVDGAHMQWRMDAPARSSQMKWVESQALHCFTSCGLTGVSNRTRDNQGD
jgi:hypothetical protein